MQLTGSAEQPIRAISPVCLTNQFIQLNSTSGNVAKFINQKAVWAYSSFKVLVLDELIIDDTKIIVNNFNDFFTNIGIKLVQTHGETDFNAISIFFSERVDSSMYLNPPCPTENFNIINALGSKKAVGCDDIIKLFFNKLSADVSAQYLYYYSNFEFGFGIFPCSYKVAKVVPID